MFRVVVRCARAGDEGALYAAAEVFAVFMNSYQPDIEGVVRLARQQAARPRRIKPVRRPVRRVGRV
jgi:hypothetical protein